jgi:YHS domain-containing protein
MKRTIAALPLLMAAMLLTACVATPGRIHQKKAIPMLDAAGGLAVEGYDVVSYFDIAEPQQGDARFAYRYQGADWYFVNAAHRDQFAADPARYAPQYGNYCAFAVSRGSVAHGDPKLWATVDGKLYLNANQFAKGWWDEDRSGNIIAGDQNWPLLPKLPPRR